MSNNTCPHCGQAMKAPLTPEKREQIQSALAGLYNPDEWQQADTGCYLLLKIMFCDAQRFAMAYGVAIGKGLGKTFTALHYSINGANNTYYVKCDERMNRSNMLYEILEAIGDYSHCLSADRAMDAIIAGLEGRVESLIILDDAQLLKDRVLHFVITLYKRLFNHVGIVLLGNDDLRNRVVEGARMNKELYADIYNTIGRRFVTLGQLGPRDVELVAKANGISDAAVIDDIKGLSKGDLHNAVSQIKKYKAEGRL